MPRHARPQLQAVDLLILQNDGPDGIGERAKTVGRAEPDTVGSASNQGQSLIPGSCQWLHPLVEGDPVAKPLVVELFWRFVQDHLQDHLQGGSMSPMTSKDLQKAGSTPTVGPKALAVTAGTCSRLV